MTNSEYSEVARLKIPVFALVEHSVYNDFTLYQANRGNTEIDVTKISYPSADSTKSFDFINEVRGNSVNNALVPFRDFADIEAYLRQQWAGMMFSFLARQNEQQRVGDTLSMLSTMSERVEMLSRQILQSVGTETAKITAELYDKLFEYECARDMAYMGVRPNPRAVLAHESFKACFAALGGRLTVQDAWQGSSLGPNGMVSPDRFKRQSDEYRKLRQELVALLKRLGLSVESYLKDATAG